MWRWELRHWRGWTRVVVGVEQERTECVFGVHYSRVFDACRDYICYGQRQRRAPLRRFENPSTALSETARLFPLIKWFPAPRFGPRCFLVDTRYTESHRARIPRHFPFRAFVRSSKFYFILYTPVYTTIHQIHLHLPHHHLSYRKERKKSIYTRECILQGRRSLSF